MTSALGALVGTAVVLLVPGLLVARLAGLRLSSMGTWALVPALSLGIVFVLAEVTTTLGSHFGVPAFLGLLALLGLFFVVSARRDRLAGRREPQAVSEAIDESGEPEILSRAARGGGNEPGAGDAADTRSASAVRLSYALLVIGIGLGVFTWTHGMHGLGLVPPREDSANHGFFVARIIHTGSVAPSKVVVTDAQGTSKVANYYPLGMHASVAIAAKLSGAHVGRLLDVFAVAFTAVVFPVGMYVLARFLAPLRVLVAGFTALLSPVLTLYAYSAIQSGLLALMVSMAIVPISVVIVTQALIRTGRVRLSKHVARQVIPAALTIVALVTVHTSEIVTVAFLVFVLVLSRTGPSRRGVVSVIGRGALVGGVALLLLAPTIAQVGSGITERSQFDVNSFGKPLSTSRAIVRTITLENPSLTTRDMGRISNALPSVRHNQARFALLAAIGAVILLLRRRRAFVIAWGVVIALTVLAYSSNSTLSRAVTFAWYRQGDRLTMNQAFFVPFFAAVALEAAVVAVRRSLATRDALMTATAMVGAAAMVAVGAQGYSQASAALHFSYGRSETPVTPASESAFTWLRRHAGPRDVVVNEFVDGSSWMYAEAHLSPLFAVRAGDGNIAQVFARLTPDLVERSYLLGNLNRVGTDARVDAAMRRLHARWLYFGESTYFPHFPHTLRLSVLRRNPHLHEVWQRDRIHVFRIDLPANAA
ncbi:MAG TPA: DUF6541 family protein [Acidimicrobiia bacterium]|nr:DUF6541 family protein [Acidimicrobiia bacterium]